MHEVLKDKSVFPSSSSCKADLEHDVKFTFIFDAILRTGEEVTSAGETRKPSLQNGVKQEACTY